MIPVEVVTKIQQDVREEIVKTIAEQTMEWLDEIGYRLQWQNPGFNKREPQRDDGTELSYSDLAEMFLKHLMTKEEGKYL